jgi:N-acetylgalactosamine-6-sulfatase
MNVYAVTWVLCLAGISADTVERPNILFILTDDLGYGDLGCYGCDDIRTPNLDRLAAEGLRFTDHYANGSTCSPTRAAFLTGRYQQRLGLDNALYYQETGRGLPPEGRTLAHDLRDAGYATGLCGKWHLGYDHARRPLQQGFDHFFGLLGGNHHYFEHLDRIGVHDLWAGNQPVHRDGYTTDLITQDAIQFLRAHRQRPFFLYLAHAAPHFPWQGPEDRERVVRPKTKSWQQGDRPTYAAMVERLDAGIGQVLSELDRLELRERTLVVFSSDNGGHTYSSNRPLRGEKAELWEGGIRVPCLARWPGVLTAGASTSLPCITMDWTATFRRVAGCPVDGPDEDGIDLVPLLTGQHQPPDRPLFWRRKSGPVRRVDNPGRAVRNGRWKLIETGDGTRLLFDLVGDLGEQQNLSDQHGELVQQLSGALDAWESSVGAAIGSP